MRHELNISVLSTLHECSENSSDGVYLYNGKDLSVIKFDFGNPVEFAKKHVHYILVCRLEKNAEMYLQIKNHALLGETYTPPFMQRIKDYLFKDAYIFTEVELERNFVEKFVYE